MSYSSRKQLRYFIREVVSEALNVDGISSQIGGLADEDSPLMATPKHRTLQQIRGWEPASYDGTPMSAIFSFFQMPASSYDLYRNFFGQNGFFNWDGITGNRASPFGSDITAIGRGLMSPVSTLLGPRDPASLGQGYWQNLRSAFSGGLAVRRESAGLDINPGVQQDLISSAPEVDPAPEPPAEVEQPEAFGIFDSGLDIDENEIISSLDRDLQKIVLDYDSIKRASTPEATISAWQEATGFGESLSQFLASVESSYDQQAVEGAMQRVEGFIKDEIAPAYYRDLITPVIDGFLSSSGQVSSRTKASAISILEDSLALIN